MLQYLFRFVFIFNDPAPTEIYTLSLHDALPISLPVRQGMIRGPGQIATPAVAAAACIAATPAATRSEEHTSELQSQFHLVCRLLLEKKKKEQKNKYH